MTDCKFDDVKIVKRRPPYTIKSKPRHKRKTKVDLHPVWTCLCRFFSLVKKGINKFVRWIIFKEGNVNDVLWSVVLTLIACFFGFLLSSLLLWAIDKRNAPPKLNSIFELKLGMSEKDLKKVVDVAALSDTLLLDFQYGQGEDLLSEKDRVKTLYLAYYEVDMNYQLKDVVLFFYRDKLFEMFILDASTRTGQLLGEKYRHLISASEYDREQKKNKTSRIWITNDDDIECLSVSIGDDSGEDEYQIYLFNRKKKEEIMAQRRPDGRKKKSEKELIRAL